MHKPIFDQKTYDEIMAIMNERKDKYGTTYKPFKSLLGGMVYCKHCGARYARQSNGKGQYYYSCYSRNKSQKKMIKDPNCKNKNFRAIELDSVIISTITQLSIDPAFIEQVKENKPVNNVGEKIKAINKEIAGITTQISNLMDLYSLGNMPIEVINQKVSALNETKTALEKELDSLDVPDTDGDVMTTE